MKQTCERFKKELDILNESVQRPNDVGDGESSDDASKRKSEIITTEGFEPTKKQKSTSFNSSK